MKFYVLGLIVFFVILMQGGEASESEEGVYAYQDVMGLVSNDVSMAASNVSSEERARLVSFFINASMKEPDVVRDVFSSVPEDQRVARLSRFINAEGISGEWMDYEDELSGFSWEYVKEDSEFVVVGVESEEPVRLVALEWAGRELSFDQEGREVEDNLILPDGYLSATFQVSDGHFFLTGEPSMHAISAVRSASLRGAEIWINSYPTNAEVFINGKKYYRRTNTSSVIDPGDVSLTIRLDGYQDWTSSKALSGGDRWQVNAVLSPEGDD